MPNTQEATRVVCVRCTPFRAALIQAAAARHGVTASEWMRRALERGLKDEGLLPEEDAREAA